MSKAAPPDLAHFSSAFIIKPSSLGDIVHALPAVHLIKKAHPHLEMRWLCNPEWMPLLEGNPDLLEVLPFPRQKFRGAGGIARFLLWSRKLNRLERAKPEIALDFQGLLRSAMVAQARGSDTIVGMSDAREGASYLFKHIVPVNAKAHAIDRCLEIPRYLGIETDENSLKLPLPSGRKPVVEGIDIPSKFILVHPYSRGSGKSMPFEALQTLCDCLAPHPVLLVGRAENATPVVGKHIISLVNKTDLSELLWLVHHTGVCLSVDSGPMHIAAAAGVPTLGVHTWSDPRMVGPYQNTAWAWKAGRIAQRRDFSDAEARSTKNIEKGDARRMADFLLSKLV